MEPYLRLFEEYNRRVNKASSPTIGVIGAGNAGSIMVTHLYNQGIPGIHCAICGYGWHFNQKEVPVKFDLKIKEEAVKPEINEINACAEDLKQWIDFHNIQLLYIVLGLGGHTGYPIGVQIANIAKERMVTTVAITTFPFIFEARTRISKARNILENYDKEIDSVVVIQNDNVQKLYNLDFDVPQLFRKTDETVCNIIRSLVEKITKPGIIPIGFDDMRSMIKDEGFTGR